MLSLLIIHRRQSKKPSQKGILDRFWTHFKVETLQKWKVNKSKKLISGGGGEEEGNLIRWQTAGEQERECEDE